MILDSLWKSVHLFFKQISSWTDFLKIIKMKTQFVFNALTLLLLIVFALEYRHYLPGFRHLWKKKAKWKITDTNYLHWSFLSETQDSYSLQLNGFAKH